MRENEKGFTLVELLAVIVILGLLMAIAIPSVTKYITQSRIKTLVTTMDSYVTAVVTQVNNGEYKFSDSTKIFAIPIECISLEKGGTNPFGNWYQANSSYWAYVLVHYDSDNYNYEYGFTFKDDAGYGLYPTINSKIENSMVKTGYSDLNQPKNGLAKNFVSINKWEGFSNVTDTTNLVVLKAEKENISGDGYNTCTLQQKGDNYDEVNKVVVKNVRVGSETYQFEEGMTWRAWFNSKYNTSEFYLFESRNEILNEDPEPYPDLSYIYVLDYDCPYIDNYDDQYYFVPEVGIEDTIFEGVHYLFRDYGETPRMTGCWDEDEGLTGLDCIPYYDHYLVTDANGNFVYVERE